MALPYSPTAWVDNSTPIDDDNLNNIENGLKDLSDIVDSGRLSDETLSSSFATAAALQGKADIGAVYTKAAANSAFARARRPKITALGDSITAQNTAGVGAAGYLTLANTLLRQRFDYALDPAQGNFFGMSGKTAEQLITEGHAALAAASDADGVIVMAGTNDIGTGRTPAQILTSLRAIWSMLLATGKYVVAGTITPRADTAGLSDLAAQASLIREANRLIREAAASTPGVYLCDWHAALVDPATGMMAAGYSREGLHPTTTGAGRMAAVLAPILSSITASTGDAALPVANGDGYFVNALEVGTSGTKTQGSSTINGTVASSWTLVAPTTGAVVTASKVARTDLWPGEWQQIEPVTLTGVQDRTYYRQQTATLASLGLAVGDRVVLDVEFETDGAGWDMRHIEAILDFPGASGGTATALSLPTQYRTDQTLPMHRMPSGVLRTAARPIPADSTAMRLTLNLYGKGIFRAGRIGIRKLAPL